MSEKEKVIFTCKKMRNLNIIKHKGATVVTATPGGTTSRMTPTSLIRFREHRYVTDDPEEIEIIRQHIKQCPSDGIMELVPKTAEDTLKEKRAKAAEAMRELEEARGAIEKVSEARKEERESKFQCPDCDFVGKNAKSLVMHKKMMHKK